MGAVLSLGARRLTLTLVAVLLFAPYRVDATLTLASDGGALLTGKYTSTKCTCDVPLTLHRLN